MKDIVAAVANMPETETEFGVWLYEVVGEVERMVKERLEEQEDVRVAMGTIGAILFDEFRSTCAHLLMPVPLASSE